jgi:hypothetical protein
MLSPMLEEGICIDPKAWVEYRVYNTMREVGVDVSSNVRSNDLFETLPQWHLQLNNFYNK